MASGKSIFTEILNSVPTKISNIPHFYLKYDDLLIEDIANFFTLIEEVRLEIAELNSWKPSELPVALQSAQTGQSINVDIIAALAQIKKNTPKAVIITTLFLGVITQGFNIYHQHQQHKRDMAKADIANQSSQLDVEIKRLELEKKRREIEKGSKKELAKKGKKATATKVGIRTPSINQTININLDPKDSATIRLATFIMENPRITRMDINGTTMKGQ